ncbi:hypothetical protein B7P43_G14028 [Cryptotermes secundus]|uniref:Uncharacterized protein n=1 Tax=Cryptotermes secundus TaxID=105785 RepID=A0A2J7RD51_9NEOP|nr:uncharacterized protein LOC111861858 [Cryptotermes secundus]PNF38764.1 hypothetical protein B7P43_G14028 [Cryptotermes secundus]
MSNIGSSSNPSANNRRFGDKVSIPRQWLSFAGDCAPLRKYLASRSYGSGWAPLKFVDALFRGYGQVVFANNPISGVLIFISLTVADPLVSAAGLLTASVGLLGSIVILPQPPEILSQGVTVFNSLLIGLITTGTLPTHYGLTLETWHWFSMIIAATTSVYVESALGNILGSLCRFPLPYLTVPFNIVQQLLFLTVISITTLNATDTPPIATHHMTSQPPLLVPSSLISIERLRQVPVDTTQPTLLSNLNALKETSPPGILIDGSTTDTDIFFGDVLEDHTTHTDTLSTQHIAVTPSEAADFEDNFPYGQIVSKSTQETVREYDRNANVRLDSKLTVTDSESIQTFTIGANDFEQKETSVTTLAPDHKQFALTESSQNASNSHLQPNSASSVHNNVELMQDAHSYTEGEVYETGDHQSIASIVMDSTTSEMTPLFSTSRTSNFNEDDVLLAEETVTIRLKRSISLEATERNPLTPHQNASFGIVEPVVDWGGVS